MVAARRAAQQPATSGGADAGLAARPQQHPEAKRARSEPGAAVAQHTAAAGVRPIATGPAPGAPEPPARTATAPFNAARGTLVRLLACDPARDACLVEDVEGAQHVVPRDAARACRLEADGDEPRWRCNGCNGG